MVDFSIKKLISDRPRDQRNPNISADSLQNWKKSESGQLSFGPNKKTCRRRFIPEKPPVRAKNFDIFRLRNTDLKWSHRDQGHLCYILIFFLVTSRFVWACVVIYHIRSCLANSIKWSRMFHCQAKSLKSSYRFHISIKIRFQKLSRKILNVSLMKLFKKQLAFGLQNV